jgi:uncharacterized membrane protein YedE/YeeE
MRDLLCDCNALQWPITLPEAKDLVVIKMLANACLFSASSVSVLAYNLAGHLYSMSGTSPVYAPQRRLLLAIAALASALILSVAAHGWRLAALAAIGILLGASLHHASFGFASAYRRLLLLGDGRGVLAQVGLLFLLTLLFTPILLSGAARGAVAPVAMQAAIGATMFGVGMQLGSGCACGTLYAIGGGSGLMLFTLASFSAGSFLATLTPSPWRGLPRMEPMSLLDRWGWSGSFLQLLLLGLLALVLWRWQPPQLQPPRRERQWFNWRTLLVGPWSLAAGSVALALLSGLVLLLAGRPWGVTWGFTLWAAKLAHQLGWDPSTSDLWQQQRFALALRAGLFEDVTSVMNFGIVLGAAAAAAASGRLSFRSPPSATAVGAALLGGLLMGYGAWLSFGCNVGAYVAGIASTSLHGWLWIVFALLGTAIGVRLRPRFGLSN